MSRAHRFTAIVPCNDLDTSEGFYARLGFRRPPGSGTDDYRMLSDGLGGEVHLTRPGEGMLVPGRNPFGLYLYAEEVDALAARVSDLVVHPPEDKPRGMYEFAVSDPDRTLVRIGWPTRLRGATARGPREGFPEVTPRIVTDDAPGVIAFLRAVFDAQGEEHADRPTEMRIGGSGSVIMVTPSGVRERFPAFLYVYVEDADAAYGRSIAAGATSVEEPIDTPYGDRRAMVRDRFGNVWQIAHVGRAALG
jgi:uncharacterized glyoxalase superfamily protein PhnB